MGPIEAIAAEGPRLVLTGGVSFGIGCLTGMMCKSPIFLTGAICSISAIASRGVDTLVKALAKRYDYKLSTVILLGALSAAVIAIAAAVGAFALGVFGIPGALGFAGSGVLFSVVQGGLGLYVRFGDKELPYNEAVMHRELFYQLILI